MDEQTDTYLTESVSKLRHLGHDLGLNDEDIDRCALKGLKGEALNMKAVLQDWKRYAYKNRVVVAAVVAPLLLLVVINLPVIESMQLFFPPEVASHVSFGILSAYRKLASKILYVADITNLYNAECVVHNPVFDNPLTSDCHVCDALKGVKQFKNTTKTIRTFLFGYVMVHRNILEKNVTLEDVVDVIGQNSALIGDRRAFSSVPWIKYPKDLTLTDLEKRITDEKDFRFKWNSYNQLFDGNLMRKLFPRPKSFPSKAESSLTKDLLIDGPYSTEYNLPQGLSGEYSWYAQGKGTRTLVFTPLTHCRHLCYSFYITVYPGDVLTYPVGGWTVRTLSNLKEISISYVSHITFM